ncbi:HAD family phosphatase [Clostridium celatum]|uniref:HAD family hydrolase n=1 Tax=Clostridium celatum TaxID=36834 RepID=UPI002900FFD6|nr:HAD family phosphatase [Clostridium celatum]MDU2266657.1 HAD family phosphatase [Clostridium celatum]MDU6297039.1 HAD family phosphatase [Clostridium celatum]
MKKHIEKAKAVIFDMDGVLFDTENVYLDVWSKVFEKYGYTMTKEIYSSVLGTGRENVKKTFLNYFGNDLPIDAMYKEKDENLAIAIDKGVPLKKGANELLIYLKENKYKIALATSATRNRALQQLGQADIEKYFDAIVTKDDIKETKPNPEIFLKAAKKLFMSPNDCIVIEDSSAGIKAAFNAEITSIHVVDLKEADDEIIELCYRSFKNLNEVQKEIEYLKNSSKRHSVNYYESEKVKLR